MHKNGTFICVCAKFVVSLPPKNIIINKINRFVIINLINFTNDMKKSILFLTLGCMMTLSVNAAKEVYTVFKDGTLTYYYDDKKDTHPSDDTVELYLPEKYDHVRFATYGDKVKKAVIDPSMEDALLTSFACMFYNWTENEGMHNLPKMETITGLEYLNTSEAKSMLGMFAGCWSLKGPLDFSYFNTSEVTDMYMMFSGCSELTELDLSSFDVSKVGSMDFMFSGCKKLQTIYCNTNWASAGIRSSSEMFEDCENLEGDKGTKWMSTYPDDITYAHPDGLGGKPGYFSQITVKEIYAVQSTDKTTLTLYYDRKREERSGVTDWTSKKGANTVILDESMKEARPISTRLWFDSMTKLTEIQNLDYLNTSRVETMEAMFYQCAALTTLDLSSFDIRNNYVTAFMFSGCSSLKTIYCNEDWSVSTTLTSSDNMFSGCTSLVGGNGTNYNDANPKDVTYARLDEDGKKGYFTKKKETAIDNVSANLGESQKLLRNGQIFILRGEKVYNAQGALVK